MSQGSILTDMFANSSASINALLAQMQNALGNVSLEGNNFSSLLSNSSTTTLTNASAALSTQVDAVTATPVTATVDTSATLSTAASSAASELKNMQDLSVILHKAMNSLRQQAHADSDHKKQNSATSVNAHQAKTQQTTISAATSLSKIVNMKKTQDASSSKTVSDTSTQSATAQTSTADASSDTTADADAGSSDMMDAQKIEKLIAELLLMTQKVIKNLQQAQSTTGTAQNAASNSSDTKIVSDLQDFLASLTGGSTGDASSTDLAAQLSSSPQEFQKLVALLQKATQQMTGNDVGAAQDNANASVIAAIPDASNLTASDILSLMAPVSSDDPSTQLAGVTAKLKNDFSTTQKQDVSNTSVQMAATTITPLTGLAATTATAKTIAATASATASQNAAQALNSNASQTQNGSSDTISTQSLTTIVSSRILENTGAGAENESSMHGGSSATNNFDASSMLNETGSTTGTTNFADHLASMRLTSTVVPQQPSPIDQAILQISRGLKNGNDQMSLQLHPADLGKITVKLDFSNDGKVQGTVTADNPKTLELLQKDSRTLERALQDAGLRADPGSLSFNLGNPSGQEGGQATAGKNNMSGVTNPDGTISADEDMGLTDAMAGAETYYITPTGVNIRV